MTIPFRVWLPGWVLAVSLVLLSPSASAGEAYVDCALGHDELGNGTAVRPWKTIHKALQEATDSTAAIWLGPGTYPERIEPPSSLRALRITGPGAAHASIDASMLDHGGDAALVLRPGQVCWLEGLTLVGGGAEVPADGETIRRNGAEVHLAGCVVTYIRWWNDSPLEPAIPPAPPTEWLLEAPAKTTPDTGFFTGFNDQDLPMTMVVASNARELRTFRYSLRIPCQNCTLNTSVSTEWWSDAPQILNGGFDFTLTLGGAGWRFTGVFENARTVAGHWYAPDRDSNCGACGGWGTWSVIRELFQPDVNHDEVINAIDIQLVINEALSTSPVPACDINGDGVTNAVDIQVVLNAVLGMVIR